MEKPPENDISETGDHTIEIKHVNRRRIPSTVVVTVTTSAESALEWIQTSASTAELQATLRNVSAELERFTDDMLVAFGDGQIPFAPKVQENEREKQPVRVLAKHKVDERRAATRQW